MIGAMIERVAQALAVIGGLLLVLLVVLTVVSISGRAMIPLGLAPIPGIYELTELGSAIAVFSFLPWCHLKRGHVTVDVFLQPLGARANALSTLAADAVFAAAAIVVCWRLWVGMLDKQGYGETTYILGLPLWQGYAGALVGAAVFVLVCLLMVCRSLRRLLSGGAEAA